ncbi:MAG TPA: hypothetical protein VHK06_00915 [Candidatus Limnocylindria bacterium]|nr:hypothetical protein [Candidatus Limnocylindria bacterium]
MWWLIAALVGLAVLGGLAFLLPVVFGPVLAGIAPLLVLLAVIGLGGIWWRASRSRVDPNEKADQR